MYKQREYFVYILTSKYNGTLYIGVTSNLKKRVFEHKNKLVKGFTEKHDVHQLVYYEQVSDVYSALTREKQLKAWKRDWKIRIINEFNPGWKDLYDDL